MKIIHLNFFASIAFLGVINGQSSDHRLREIERRLDAANSELAEINDRERAKEQAAIKAEEERLVALPLDPDLITLCKMNFKKVYASGIKDPYLKAKLCRDFRISMARTQEKRNALK
jgi:hypothetical protein